VEVKEILELLGREVQVAEVMGSLGLGWSELGL
jgi:hypothetical protein